MKQKTSIFEKMYLMIAHANTDTSGLAVVPDEVSSPVADKAMEKLAEFEEEIGYVLTGYAEDYPDTIWTIVFNEIIKPTTYEWLNEHRPKAWFKDIFKTKHHMLF
jgi:hypothetical protein